MKKKDTRRVWAVAAAGIATAGIVLAAGIALVCGRGTSAPESSALPTAEPTSSVTTTTATAPTATVATTTTAPPATAATTATTTANRTTAENATATTLLSMDPAGHYVQRSIPAWNLLLVNDWNPLPENYDAAVSFVSIGNRNQKVDARIAEPLKQMMKDGAAYGIDVQSGYRPASQQSTLYWRKVNEYRKKGFADAAAQQKAGTVVKRPGYSEHNSGLAVDLGGSGNFSLTESFKNTPAYRWLIDHCANYGFVLRFPRDKEAVTGVIYEAWHFRYVGVDAAREITENHWCLEEYLEHHAAG